MLTRLDPVDPTPPGRPEVAGADHPMRRVTIEAAAGQGWDAERITKVTQLFDGLAPGWSARVANEAIAPVLDAIGRAGVPAGGRCIEVGSGTGNVTGVLADAFDVVVCVDLSWEMLIHAPPLPGWRVRADAAQLPVASRSVDVVALVNAFLFPGEVDRVLGRHGVVVWVSTLGDQTPIYLPPEEVLGSLPGDWDGVTSRSGWAEWLVAVASDDRLLDDQQERVAGEVAACRTPPRGAQ